MNKISIPFVKKTTRDFIRQVRAAKTAAEERAIISKESALIRNAFREEDKVNAQSNMAKLLFIHLMGYPSYFGQVQSVKLIGSPNFGDKRIGYLSLALLVNEENDIFLLVTNTLKNDLNSGEQFVEGLALTAAANVCSDAMARDIFADVLQKMSSSNPFIKKKACLCMINILSKIPEMVDDMIKSLPTLLGDDDHGVLISAISLTQFVLHKNPSYISKFRKLVPRLIKKMKVIISGGFKSEYNIGGVPDPFLQVEMLKLLCLLATNDHDSSDQLGDLLALIATKTDSSCMAGNAVLYETVKTIMSIDAVSGQRVLGANILGKFLLHNDSNIRYVALSMLLKMAEIDHAAVARHRSTILGCLKENDPSIRRRALEVVFALVTLRNVEELVRELLNYLTIAADDERPELLSRITSLVQQFAPSSLWQVDTLLAVLQSSGRYVNEEVSSALVSIVGNEEDVLASYTTHRLVRLIQHDMKQVALTQVAVWFIGEYADELMQSFFDANRQQQFDALAPSEVIDLLGEVLSAAGSDSTTKAMTLTALLKCADRLEGCEDRVAALMRPFETSSGLQIQQRSCEYDELLQDAYAGLREGILERMPPLNIDHAKARRAEAEEGEDGDEEDSEEGGEAAEDWMDANPSSAAKAEPAGDLMDDLLGVNFNPTPSASAMPMAMPMAMAKPQQAQQQQAKSDDPFSGVMDMLKTMDASAAQPAAEDTAMDIASLFPTSTPVQTAQTAQAGAGDGLDGFGVVSGSPMGPDTGDAAEDTPMENRSTMTVFDEDGIKIVFKMKKGADEAETIIKAVISNANQDDVEEFAMQAAVPKYMKVQMKPISDPIVPGGNEDVSTQLIRVRNNAFGEKATVMRLRISYDLNGEVITKVCTVNDIPDEL